MNTGHIVQDYINKCSGDPTGYTKAAKEAARQAVQDEINAGRTTWGKVQAVENDFLCLVAQTDDGWGSPTPSGIVWGILLLATIIFCISIIYWAISTFISPLVSGVTL